MMMDFVSGWQPKTREQCLRTSEMSLFMLPLYTPRLSLLLPCADKLVHTKFIFNCGVISPRPHRAEAALNSSPFVTGAF